MRKDGKLIFCAKLKHRSKSRGQAGNGIILNFPK